MLGHVALDATRNPLHITGKNAAAELERESVGEAVLRVFAPPMVVLRS